MLSHRRTQPPSSLPLSSLVLRGATEPCPPITPGARGLQCSPEGRQLSISDNCQERDTHACAQTHKHISACSYVNQGAIA